MLQTKMIIRSLLYILPLPLFIPLVEAKLPWFSALAFSVGLVYYFQMENSNKRYFISTGVSIFLIPLAGLYVHHFGTDEPFDLIAFAPTTFLILRTRTSVSNLFIKLLGPTGIFFSGIFLTLTFGEAWSYIGLVFLTFIYFLKKLLVTNELFFRNWILAILSSSILFLIAYSVILHGEMTDQSKLRNKKQEDGTRNSELELCEQKSEKTGLQ
ncbi:MAG: hypothetical protein JXR03_20355 [Cyclobacteriaceae bacterium]